MKIFVIGSGAREHAILWALNNTNKSGKPHELFCAPGNGGISQIAKCFPVKADNLMSLLELAREIKPDITIVGPEVPLVAGIADMFTGAGFPVVGPSKEAAQLEGSKMFAKRFMRRHGIPTADATFFHNPEYAKFYIENQNRPLVVKADGLAAGKGVVVASSAEEALSAIDDIMVQKKFGDKAGEWVVIEEKLEGQECSCIVLSDGISFPVSFRPAKDHKRRFDGDKGPNTGGMGCYSPVPELTPELESMIMDEIVGPTLYGMAEDGNPYRGFLYFGLMLTAEGPKVLEFNCRLGDPEASVILPLMQSDFAELLLASATGNLNGTEIGWSDKRAICTVVAARDYPDKGVKDEPIHGLLEAERTGALIFHAGTTWDQASGRFFANGGRILNAVGIADNFPDAHNLSLRAAHMVHFTGRSFREDIGRGLE